MRLQVKRSSFSKQISKDTVAEHAHHALCCHNQEYHIGFTRDAL